MKPSSPGKIIGVLGMYLPIKKDLEILDLQTFFQLAAESRELKMNLMCHSLV